MYTPQSIMFLLFNFWHVLKGQNVYFLNSICLVCFMKMLYFSEVIILKGCLLSMCYEIARC